MFNLPSDQTRTKIQPQVETQIPLPVEENPLYKKISYKTFQSLFALLLFGQIIIFIEDYYSLVREYNDYGAFESVLTYAGALVVVYLLSFRFFLYMAPRCKKMFHIAMVLVLPSIFLEIVAEIYFDEVIHFDRFYKWFISYDLGAKAYKSKKYEKSLKSFKYSVSDLKPKESDSDKYLYQKSNVFILKIELDTSLLKMDRKQLLSNFISLNQSLTHFSQENSVDQLIVLDSMAQLFHSFKSYDEANQYIDQCLKMAQDLKLSDQALQISCKYTRLLCLFESKEALEWEEIMGEWNTIFPYYIKMVQKEKQADTDYYLQRIFKIVYFFKVKDKEELALEYSITILDILRSLKVRKEVLKELYKMISELYYGMGKNTHGDLYKKRSEDLEI